MKFSKLFKVINTKGLINFNDYKEQIRLIVCRYNKIYNTRINSYGIYNNELVLDYLTESELTPSMVVDMYKIVNYLNVAIPTDLKLVQIAK